MKKVVIVDDEYYFRKALMNNIEWDENGFVVVGDANNGKDAFDLICREKPDIAVLDINMPEMDGLMLIEKLTEAGVECKYIIISGYDDFRYAQQAIVLGVSEYILKPVDYDCFLESLLKLKRVIEGREQESIIITNQNNEMTNYDVTSHGSVTSRVEHMIKNNYTDPALTNTSIARALHLNYSYICYCFKRDTHSTINDYISKMRIDRAKQMFREGYVNITHVAQEVGFTNIGYFSRRFKQTTGQTPSKYIKSTNKL